MFISIAEDKNVRMQHSTVQYSTVQCWKHSAEEVIIHLNGGGVLNNPDVLIAFCSIRNDYLLHLTVWEGERLSPHASLSAEI